MKANNSWFDNIIQEHHEAINRLRSDKEALILQCAKLEEENAAKSAELRNIGEEITRIFTPLRIYAETHLHPAWGNSLILQAVEYMKQQDADLFDCNNLIMGLEGDCDRFEKDLAAARARCEKMEVALNEILSAGMRLGEFTHKNAFDVLNIHVGIARAALELPEPPEAKDG